MSLSDAYKKGGVILIDQCDAEQMPEAGSWELAIERMMELQRRSAEVVTVECPGGPQDGCCEFCTGSCCTLYLDGKKLTTVEEEFVSDLIYGQSN